MAYTTNKNIKQLDASSGVSSTDLVPLWDSASQTSKKATLPQLDPVIFRTRPATTSATATTGTPDKQLMLFSLNADTTLNTIERTSITSLKAMVAPTSINGAIIQNGTVDVAKLSGTIPPGTLPVLTVSMLPSNIPATLLTGPLSSTVTLPAGFITAAALPAVLDISGKTVTLPNASVTAPMLATSLDLSGKTSVILPPKSVTTAMLADTLNFTGKTVTLPTGTVLPALGANTVGTSNITANSVTPAKMALGGKELVSAFAKVSCDIFASKAIDFTVGKTVALTRKTGYSRTLTFSTTDSGYEVGDWVCLGISTARTAAQTFRPNPDLSHTSFSQQAFSPIQNGTAAAQEKFLCFLNDFDLGGDIPVSSMVAGGRYVIKTVGTTQWGSLSAYANAPVSGIAGESFTAIGAGSGTGVVSEIQNEQPGIWKIAARNAGASFEIECPGVVPSGVILQPTGFQATVVRLKSSSGVYKVGRVPGVGKYRVVYGTASAQAPRADADYVFMPSAQNALDVTVSCGVTSTTEKYTDFMSTAAADEISFIVAG